MGTCMAREYNGGEKSRWCSNSTPTNSCRAREDSLKRITSCHYCGDDCCDNNCRGVDCSAGSFHTRERESPPLARPWRWRWSSRRRGGMCEGQEYFLAGGENQFDFDFDFDFHFLHLHLHLPLIISQRDFLATNKGSNNQRNVIGNR